MKTRLSGTRVDSSALLLTLRPGRAGAGSLNPEIGRRSTMATEAIVVINDFQAKEQPASTPPTGAS
jgi:hypothetical protein